jgi:hypothetical protein
MLESKSVLDLEQKTLVAHLVSVPCSRFFLFISTIRCQTDITKSYLAYFLSLVASIELTIDAKKSGSVFIKREEQIDPEQRRNDGNNYINICKSHSIGISEPHSVISHKACFSKKLIKMQELRIIKYIFVAKCSNTVFITLNISLLNAFFQV